ncbi:hypothetical protein BDV93DRAFT_516111 [Ceratobasidium sp. AG-I]|nr:hypothetical protein BDV93DRAFT_516111 [Ceratobasidium sp. AG-I]
MAICLGPRLGILARPGQPGLGNSGPLMALSPGTEVLCALVSGAENSRSAGDGREFSPPASQSANSWVGILVYQEQGRPWKSSPEQEWRPLALIAFQHAVNIGHCGARIRDTTHSMHRVGDCGTRFLYLRPRGLSVCCLVRINYISVAPREERREFSTLLGLGVRGLGIPESSTIVLTRHGSRILDPAPGRKFSTLVGSSAHGSDLSEHWPYSPPRPPLSMSPSPSPSPSPSTTNAAPASCILSTAPMSYARPRSILLSHPELAHGLRAASLARGLLLPPATHNWPPTACNMYAPQATIVDFTTARRNPAPLAPSSCVAAPRPSPFAPRPDALARCTPTSAQTDRMRPTPPLDTPPDPASRPARKDPGELGAERRSWPNQPPQTRRFCSQRTRDFTPTSRPAFLSRTRCVERTEGRFINTRARTLSPAEPPCSFGLSSVAVHSRPLQGVNSTLDPVTRRPATGAESVTSRRTWET